MNPVLVVVVEAWFIFYWNLFCNLCEILWKKILRKQFQLHFLQQFLCWVLLRSVLDQLWLWSLLFWRYDFLQFVEGRRCWFFVLKSEGLASRVAQERRGRWSVSGIFFTSFLFDSFNSNILNHASIDLVDMASIKINGSFFRVYRQNWGTFNNFCLVSVNVFTGQNYLQQIGKRIQRLLRKTDSVRHDVQTSRYFLLVVFHVYQVALKRMLHIFCQKLWFDSAACYLMSNHAIKRVFLFRKCCFGLLKLLSVDLGFEVFA